MLDPSRFTDPSDYEAFQAEHEEYRRLLRQLVRRKYSPRRRQNGRIRRIYILRKRRNR